ncbi:MAG TPA: PLP-dependent aminotransferase family protein [Candidatus Aminicenantes bacterium]|nr:PLP-dependent aminotransferase family protein [Candidatus Aminicenantes bacterium]
MKHGCDFPGPQGARKEECMLDLEKLYSTTARATRKSAIRELLKLADKPEVISFAGGWPSPDLFPVDTISDLMVKVLKERGRKVLHYSKAEGEVGLKEELIRLMAKDGVTAEAENILVLTGSQQGLDMLPKAFVDRGDVVFVETPTYVGAIQAFDNYGTHMVPVETDDNGMDAAALEKSIAEWKQRGQADRLKMVYLIPDFQNPSGITMTEERRRGVLEVAARHGLLVVDDAPYRDLRFEGEPVPSLYALDKKQSVISLYTFSKTLVPGLRVAWAVGPRQLIDKLTTLKQSVDLCSSALSQHVVADYLAGGCMERYLPMFNADYRHKRDIMLDAMDKYLPKLEGLKWTRPEGGLFIWVTLPEKMDAEKLFHAAVRENVAFVLGSAFHPSGGLKNCFRLNFSFAAPDRIHEGVSRLGRALTKFAQESA